MTVTEIFLFAFNAIAPIILVILLGWILGRIRFYDEHFLKTANRFMFNVALPVLLFKNVYSVERIDDIDWAVVLFCAAVITVLFVIGFLVTLPVKDAKQKGVMWQNVYRSNFAIIGLPLAAALGGDSGMALTAVLSAFTIPLFNAMAVISLSVFVNDGKTKRGILPVILKMIKNPLIIGVGTGLIVLVIRHFIPLSDDGVPVFTIKNNLPFLYTAVDYIAKIASPLALVVLGGKFRFDAIKGMTGQIVSGTAIRIIAAPLIGIGSALLISKAGLMTFTPAHYASFIALFGSPVAVSSAVMAGEMKNDEQLAGQLVVWTSLFSMLTIFITVVILKFYSLL